MKKLIPLLFGLYFSPFFLMAQTLSRELVVIETDLGTMRIRLYEETPKHKNNFLQLIRSGFYDSLLFHRVIQNFMIQGGDPESKRCNDTAMLGMCDAGYWIPAEFNQKLYHKKGVISAAREGDDVNPGKESSGCQFYIVQGKTYDEQALAKAEIRVNRSIVQKINYTVAFGGKSKTLRDKYMKLLYENKEDSMKTYAARLEDPASVKAYESTPHYTFSQPQRLSYSKVGGTPHLDNNYTVFGEVVEGMDVIDKIAAAKTDKRDRPLKNIRMKMRVEGEKK